jgi:3-hydroxybutyrate dehydrogenase
MLTGKVALITGSTSGIGLGIAKKLASLGATLAINGFGDTTEIQHIVTDLSKSSNAPVKYYPTDMSDGNAIDKMMADIARDLGPIDILVNNAGIQHVSPVEDFPTDKWNAIISINLTSVFHTTRGAVPSMKANGWGRIINIASAHSLVASPFKSAYVAAKHGVAGFTKTIALETAEHGICVNAISPGYVLTPLVSAQIPDTAQARGITEEEVVRDVLLAAQPTKEFVAIEDIAEMVTFLCGDAAKGMTGSNISMDGGWTAK